MKKEKFIGQWVVYNRGGIPYMGYVLDADLFTRMVEVMVVRSISSENFNQGTPIMVRAVTSVDNVVFIDINNEHEFSSDELLEFVDLAITLENNLAHKNLFSDFSSAYVERINEKR